MQSHNYSHELHDPLIWIIAESLIIIEDGLVSLISGTVVAFVKRCKDFLEWYNVVGDADILCAISNNSLSKSCVHFSSLIGSAVLNFVFIDCFIGFSLVVLFDLIAQKDKHVFCYFLIHWNLLKD